MLPGTDYAKGGINIFLASGSNINVAIVATWHIDDQLQESL
jgi:hypothetical protein